MDEKRFELTMRKFFEKAGVSLLKKGTDYEEGTDLPPYILLDAKRKTFYLAQTDIPDDTDEELKAKADFLVLKEGVPLAAALPFLALGKATAGFKEDFAIPQTDISSLSRKGAFIISEENAEKVSGYLKEKGAVFQSAPLKGAFLVMFLDKENSRKLAEAYLSVTEEYNGSAEKETGEEENEDTPSAQDSLLDEIPSPNPMAQEEPLPSDDVIKPEEEELLEKIDLADIIKPAEEKEPETEEEADLLYGRILNEKARETLKNAPPPSARNASEIPEGIIGDGEEALDVAFTSKETPKAIHKDKNKKETSLTRSVNIPASRTARIAANISGLIFFTPVYVLGKILSRVFPAFLIYWIGAIAALAGAYEWALSFAAPFIYDPSLKTAEETALYAASLLNSSSSDFSALAWTAKDITLTSLVWYYGEISAAASAQGPGLLRYLLSLGAVLMIFPFSRKFGSGLTIFSLLAFFVVPLTLLLQSLIIKSVSAGWAAIPPDSKEGVFYAAVSSGASGTAFAVFIIPLFMLALLVFFSYRFIPDKNKFHGVLP